MTETIPLWVQIIKVCVLLVGFVCIAPVAVWAERRFAGFMQLRLGPNRVGPFGILQPIADAIKLLFKEEYFPKNVNKGLFLLAPFLALFVALFVFTVVPIAAPLELMNGQVIYLQAANPNIGILFVLAISSLMVLSIMLAGWSSNSKYSFLGALRSSAQMVSYELAMSLAVVSAVLVYGTVDLQQIVMAQSGIKWGVLVQPLACLIYLIAMFAESNRAPFDLPEGEQEIVAGYHTEYGGMKFASFFFAEYLNAGSLSAIMVTLFFGGWHGLEWIGHLFNAGPIVIALLQVSAFVGKLAFFIFLFIWVRWTYPRFRYDQLMRLGWKVLLPFALLNLMVSALLIYWGIL
ncbi:NADH-quinone oxidoreductase subunit NuoH [Bdellovibrionota bacterium]